MNCITAPDPSPSPTPDPKPTPDPCDAKCKADKEAQAAIMREFWKFCYDWTVGAFANSFVIKVKNFWHLFSGEFNLIEIYYFMMFHPWIYFVWF